MSIYVTTYVVLLLSIFYTATTISFNQSTYSVYENNGPVQPVLVLSKPSSVGFAVIVRDYSITASSELHTYICI